MNKDELIEKINDDIATWSKEEMHGSDSHKNGVVDGLGLARTSAKQLEEPKTLSPEWIEDMEFQHPDLTEPFVKSRFLKNLLIPNQSNSTSLEKPVVPQYVADWISAIKPDNSLRVAFEYIAQRKKDYYDDELAFWIEEGNSETFARAWLDGWKVEEEKVYEVKLEANGYGLTPSSLIVLYESVGGKIILREITKEHYDDSKRRVPNSYYLTEKQIKGYDERFWPFAEPVEEVE